MSLEGVWGGLWGHGDGGCGEVDGCVWVDVDLNIKLHVEYIENYNKIKLQNYLQE